MSRRDYYHVAGAPKPNSIVPAASGVVIDGQRIILQRRADTGWWSLPGGVMHVGESIEETCVREVKEETGFVVLISRLVGVYSDPNHVIEYSDGEIRQQFSVCYLCQVTGGELRNSEESIEVAAFTRSQLAEMVIHPAQMLRIEDAWDGYDEGSA